MANIERLEQLKRVVRDAPDNEFDMAWFGLKNECGTVCCAAGRAAIDPWFLENTEISEILPLAKTEIRKIPPRLELFDIDFTGDVPGPIERISVMFGLSSEDGCALFNGNTSETVTKTDVIENIDRLIAGLTAFEYAGGDGEEF